MLAKAQKPSQETMKPYGFYKGKIEVEPKGAIRDLDDFATWRTRGVRSLKPAFLEQDIGPVSIDVVDGGFSLPHL